MEGESKGDLLENHSNFTVVSMVFQGWERLKPSLRHLESSCFDSRVKSPTKTAPATTWWHGGKQETAELCRQRQLQHRRLEFNFFRVLTILYRLLLQQVLEHYTREMS